MSASLKEKAPEYQACAKGSHCGSVCWADPESSPTHRVQIILPWNSFRSVCVPQNTHALRRGVKMMRSSSTEISSSAPSLSPKLRRSSAGRTIRPRSSTFRLTPVFTRCMINP